MNKMQKSIVYIDTNIFLRFLVFDETNPTLSKKAKNIIKNIRDQKILAKTNVCIVSELVYVLEGYYELNKTEVIDKIIPLLSLDKLLIDQKALILSALYIYVDKNVDFEDAFSYVLMKNDLIKEIHTFDKKHFKRFEDIKVLN